MRRNLPQHIDRVVGVRGRRLRNYTGSSLISRNDRKFSKMTKAGKGRRAALSRQYKALRSQGYKKAWSHHADEARYKLIRNA